MGSSNENSAYGPSLNPWDRTRVPGGSSGGSAAAVAAGSRRGRSARTRAARSASPPRCAASSAQADLRRVSRYGMIAFASSLDQAGPFTRDVTDAALLLGAMAAATLRLDVARPARAGRAARPRPTCAGIRSACPRSCRRGASSRACSRLPADARPAPRARRDVETMRLPHAPARAARLLPDRPGRVLEQPRPLRRRPLRHAAPRPATCVACTPARARGLRRGGQAADHARHLRAVVGLLRRLLRPRAEGAHEDRRGLPRGVRALRLRRHPDQPERRLRARAKTDDPLAMYLNDYCTRADVPRRHSRVSLPCGLSGALPVGPAARGPAFAENRDPRRGARARAGLRLRRTGRGREHRGRTRRSSGWRSTSSSPRARRCSAAARSGSASRRTPARARSASGLPGTLPVANAEAIHHGLMIGLGAGLRARAAVDLPPQELLLSRPAQGLPDLPVRRAPVPRRRARRRARSPRSTSRRTRRSSCTSASRAHPRLGRERRRLQPRRHAAGRDGHRARPALGRAGARVAARCCARRCASSASPTSNMEEGSLRCDANVSVRPRAPRSSGTKTELKNMNSFRFLEQGINAEIARQTRCRGGRAVVPGDAALRPAHGRDLVAALQGGGARLPLLPGARPRARSRRPPRCSSGARAALPELPAARAERYERELRPAADDARRSRLPPELGRLLEARRRRRTAPSRAPWPTGSRRARRPLGADADPAASR
jgi:aspartyl-tRNA(Asn)/glutamyl-tRNA(Gln) amidotransferase subunit A